LGGYGPVRADRKSAKARVEGGDEGWWLRMGMSRGDFRKLIRTRWITEAIAYGSTGITNWEMNTD
jgi:hypothetical protein